MKLEKNVYVNIKNVSENICYAVYKKLVMGGAICKLPFCTFKCYNYVGLTQQNTITLKYKLLENDGVVSALSFLKRNLDDLSLQEYDRTKRFGMLWVIFPEATGNVHHDLQAVRVNIHTTKDENGKNKVQHFYDIIDEDLDIELFTSDA